MKKTTKIPDCNSCKNKHSFFCDLSRKEKERIGENKKAGVYKKGEVIFNEGGLSNKLYCIYDGKVKLTKLGKDGKEQLVRFSKSADILGYRALFNNEPYSATATALEETSICFLSKDTILSALKNNSDLSFKLIRLLSSNLKSAENQMINLVQRTATERLILALLFLQDTFGFLDDGKTLAVKLSRTEIADIAGISSETAIRLLIKLRDRGLLVLDKKKIIIPDLAVLKREVDSV